MGNNIIQGSFYLGSRVNWLSQIPEQVVDSLIEMLSLQSSDIIKQVKDETGNILYTETLKDKLWSNLVIVVYGWGGFRHRNRDFRI